ncbi:MAG: hypothetical protein CVU66_00680 [Deltaproteobacteria bacterium HGW-Deltaproteobacteria-23]|nr:MAG: hypothetical protein CVU66_00680 [Deltaproteobacteria bacterium HGW-Deltaproteobacteria-23]
MIMSAEIWTSIIQTVAVVVASGAAIWGVNSWRREAEWKRKYELAEEVLSLFYDAEERFDIIRSPVSNSGEGKTRKKGENETPDDSDDLDNAYIVPERIEKEKALFNKLKALKYRFQAIFGEESVKPFNEIEGHLMEIQLANIRLHRQYYPAQNNNNYTEEQFERHLKDMHENEAIIWTGFDVTDKFQESVKNTISKIEGICKPIIQNRVRK